jgi:hypothetical protein
MLQGMPFDDPHYTRGLYAKSRRNVSAGNSSVYAVKTGLLIKDRNFNDNADFVSLCLDFVKQGYRHIYTPYLQAVGEKRLIDKFYDIDLKPGYEDIYLNPNFNHDNERMEVRA